MHISLSVASVSSDSCDSIVMIVWRTSAGQVTRSRFAPAGNRVKPIPWQVVEAVDMRLPFVGGLESGWVPVT